MKEKFRSEQMSAVKSLTRVAKRISFRSFFWADRVGLHILPKYYGTPIPDYKWLRSNLDLWTAPSKMTGIHWNLDEQADWLERVVPPFYSEVSGLTVFREYQNNGWGVGYGQIESQVLHCFVRTFAPKRIIEIGSGVSTGCMLHANALNCLEGKTGSTITCIEPYPSEKLMQCKDVNLLATTAQAVNASIVDQLQEGDLLFIDSSHAVKVGSDVVKIYLEILPRLNPGVHVHIHDIYLPYLYPRDAMEAYFSAQENVLLAALLVNNDRLRVNACLSALHYDRTEQLKQMMADYVPQQGTKGLRAGDGTGFFPSSCWLQTIKS